MSNIDRFIRYLNSLKHENSGKLAALRRACGQRLAESHNCQDFTSISTHPADFLTATLAAQYSASQIQGGKYHTTYRNRGSVGAAWAKYCREGDPDKDPATFYQRRQEALAKGQDPPRPPSIHERFRTLLDAELERDGTGELAYRLRGLVRMLVDKDIAIDVVQLAHDLRGWHAESRYVQDRWAKAFYSPPLGAADQSNEPEDPQTSDDEQEESIGEETETHVD